MNSRLHPLILFVLVPMSAFYALVFSQNWIPIHDTLLSLQWHNVFFQGLAHHTLPIWHPHLAYGQPTNLALVHLINPVGWLLGGVAYVTGTGNALTYFLTMLLSCELILALGSYLFALRVFGSRYIATFVTVLLIGSVSWSPACDTNFLTLYPLPLILYLAVRGLDERSINWLAASAFIAASTLLIGGATYVGGFRIVTILVFLGLTIFFTKPALSALFKSANWLTFVWIGAIAVTAIVLGLFLFNHGMLAIMSPGRAADGGVSYDQILRFGYDRDLFEMNGFPDGLRLGHDFSLYSGVVTVPLLFLALFFTESRWLKPMALSAFILFLGFCSRDSFVSPILYFIPGLKILRSPANYLPFVKFFCIFIAGLGLQTFLSAERDDVSERRKSVLLKLVLCIAVGCILHFFLVPSSQFGQVFIPPLQRTQRWIIILSIVCFLVMAVRLRRKRHPNNTAFKIGLLVLCVVDLFSHRVSVLHIRMQFIDKGVRQVFALKPIQWVSARIGDAFQDDRFHHYANYLVGKRDVPPEDRPEPEVFATCISSRGKKACGELNFLGLGVPYFLTEPTLGMDPCLSVGLGLHATPYVASVVRNWQSRWPYLIDNPTKRFLKDGGMRAALGCEAPKARLVHQLTDPAAWGASTGDLAVEAFDWNRVRMTISGATPGSFLYYADSWHPHWHANWNGTPVSVQIAQKAFKAVRIPEASGSLEFTFDTRRDVPLAIAIFFLSLLVLTTMLLLLFKAGREEQQRAAAF